MIKTTHQYIDQFPYRQSNTSLILGTIHPHKTDDFKINFFYGNKVTIWGILAEAFPDQKFDSRTSIEKTLRKNNVWISDIILSCERAHDSVTQDALLENLELNSEMIEEGIRNSLITEIFFTSGFNKNGAAKLFCDVFSIKSELDSKREFKIDAKYFGREIVGKVLFSPSGQANIGISNNKEFIKQRDKYVNSTRAVQEFKVDTYRKAFHNQFSIQKSKKVKSSQLYLSKLLIKEYPKVWNTIKRVLDKYQISPSFLEVTNDIWCRDYMPIKTSKGELVQFRYEPSYLRNNPQLQSDPTVVNTSNNISAIYSGINLDGGNIELLGDTAILTERIFKENLPLPKEEVIKNIEKVLGVKSYFVRDMTEDMTGHIDGYLRIIREGLLVVNELGNDFKYIRDSFLKMNDQLGWDYVEMPWFDYRGKDKTPECAIGIYTNFLVFDEIVLFPIFEVEGNKDNEALEVISKLYPEKKIEPININEVVMQGGLINCISWVN
ncbi:agmatine deiminase family protein [Flammeovirga pacifica]|uniref:Peptidyl-arginine deiminase n=1 Tax=Flammeovirga pacifica TaxID=915059 RepID=A0A1S1YTH4_FLAPC|nr:agmatine deiminase family protein [Flammeovirga pacifica]OHX64319.1 hypothetical protein NH26_22250 [Flammeovirga pacifica]